MTVPLFVGSSLRSENDGKEGAGWVQSSTASPRRRSLTRSETQGKGPYLRQ
ncbi:hypothetical protein GCM10027567_09880 [Spongiibacter taiwanensis]